MYRFRVFASRPTMKRRLCLNLLSSLLNIRRTFPSTCYTRYIYEPAFVIFFGPLLGVKRYINVQNLMRIQLHLENSLFLLLQIMILEVVTTQSPFRHFTCLIRSSKPALMNHHGPISLLSFLRTHLVHAISTPSPST